MKKAFINIFKTVVCAISAYILGQGLPLQMAAASSNCPLPPSHIQIVYQFDWSPTEQKHLFHDFQLKCGLPEDVDWLVRRTTMALKVLGFNVTKSTLSLGTEFGQAKIELETDRDDGQSRSVLFPVKYLELDDSILSHAEITGVVREDETLVLRYVLEDSRMRDSNSRVIVQWLRDERQVKGANTSRYKLTSDDVGGQITALISVLDSRNIVHAKRKVTLKHKVGEVISAPEARGLKIEGEAIVGKVVTASYTYADRNKIDKEQNSNFVWMRDNFIVKEARGATYQIVPEDMGKRISVQVTPRNNRNEIGQTVVAEMDQVVEDELAMLRPSILTGIDNVSSELNLFESLKIKRKVFSVSDEVRLTPQKMAKSSLNEASAIYLTPELSIQHASTRKITNVVFYPNNPFTKSFSDSIKHQFFGKEISFRTIEILLGRLNAELTNANYASIEAYFPEQVVNAGVLKIHFRKIFEKVDSSQENTQKEISGLKIFAIGLGLACCL